ncbi:unnamed protein product [Rhizophagus irregularis]|nr:unnamed protein product [Rhizophagus irregularis]
MFQDAWFTASSLHAVIESLETKPEWITFLSDNGPTLSQRRSNVNFRTLERMISHAINRYVRLGFDISEGVDIRERY